MLAFGGSRTFHRIAVAIEDAGFELRDTLMWVFSQGFPKGHNVAKAITALEKTGKSNPKGLRKARMGEDYEPTGQVDYRKGRAFSNDIENDDSETELTPNAQKWLGWNCALKPAYEPIILARKPLEEKSIAANVLKWGTGAINVDGCRVGTESTVTQAKTGMHGCGSTLKMQEQGFRPYKIDNRKKEETVNPPGRWPANLLLGWPEDEYELKDNISADNLRQLAGWLDENPKL